MIRHPYAALLGLGVFLAGLTGCFEAPKEAVAPTTDVQLSMPLADRTFLIGEFADDEPLITPMGNGTYMLRTSGQMAPISLDGFEIELDTASRQATLGSFVVDDPPPTLTRVSYQEITGVPPPPVPTPAPEASYIVPGTDLGPTDTFERVTFEAGSATLRVRNTLPIPVDFPSGIRLRNNRTAAPVDTSTVVQFSFGTRVIPPGGEDSSVVDLAGVSMQTFLRIMDADLHTAGSGGASVSIGAQDGLELRLIVTGVRVLSALAMIPSQPMVSLQDTVVAFDDSVSLQQATFNGGSFSVTLENGIDADVTAYCRLEELIVRSTGVPFTVTHQFSGRGTWVLQVDLRDLMYQSSRDTIGTYATLTLGIGTLASQTVRQVNSTDGVRAMFEPTPGDPVTMESLTGRITPTTIWTRQGAGLDLGELNDKFTGTITFDSVTVGLNMELTSGFPFDYDLKLIGMKTRVSPAVIDSLVLPPPAGSSIRRIYPVPGQTTRIELKVSDGLRQFLSTFQPGLPDTLIVGGSLLLNPPDVFATPEGRQTIYDTSKAYSSYDLSFPLKIGILNGEVTDTVRLDDSGKIPDDFTASVKRGTMYFDVTNATPMGLTFRGAFLKETAPGVFDTLLRVPSTGVRLVTPGTVDPQSGIVISPQESVFELVLSDADMQLYNQCDVFWFKFGLITSGGGTTPVTFRSTDYVRVRASGNIVYRLE